MKKLLLLLIPLLFISCSRQEYYVMLTINDDNITYHNFSTGKFYMETQVGCNISGRWFLVPYTDKDFEIESLASTDPSVIEITSIDYENKTFRAKAKKKGVTKLKVSTEKYYSSTTANIEVN